MTYAHLTDDELHRIARDSTDSLTLELMRRMDVSNNKINEARAVLHDETLGLSATVEQALEALED